MPARTSLNQVRIVGGQWRGRKLSFPDLPGLRPTPDRVRETLFNWLAPVIAGSRCLDLFAGSGALGFEAASRGAAEVVLVERDPAIAKSLREQAQLLRAETVEIMQADALQYLQGTPRKFDILLLDPPFEKGLLESALAALAPDQLASVSWIYLEAERALGSEQLSALLPEGFELYRSKATGQVGYHLARRL
ncbi:MAG: 16S rRNA (guanine(966)-N(2))-methyltransferase RsmD [Gammaproteobacteria bacterium]|nr:16S rRNA (guanine(966)-N(2))-methyltransferase RsmD [Gammaproteobacteria bacterium]